MAGNIVGTLLLTKAVSPTAVAESVASLKIAKPAEYAIKSALPFGAAMGIMDTSETVNDSIDLGRSAKDTAIVGSVRFVSSLSGNMVGFGVVPAMSTLMVNRWFSQKVFSPVVTSIGEKALAGAEFSAYGTTERVTNYMIGKTVDNINDSDLYADASINSSDALLEFGMGVGFKTSTQSLSGFLSWSGRKAFDKVSEAVEKKAIEGKAKAETGRMARTNTIWAQIETEFKLGDVNLQDRKMSDEFQNEFVSGLRAYMKGQTDKEKAFKDYINNNLDTEYWGPKNIKSFINSVWY